MTDSLDGHCEKSWLLEHIYLLTDIIDVGVLSNIQLYSIWRYILCYHQNWESFFLHTKIVGVISKFKKNHKIKVGGGAI